MVSGSEPSSSRPGKSEEVDIVHLRLQEALADAQDRGAQQLKLDRAFVEAIYNSIDSRKAEVDDMRSKFDGMKVRPPLSNAAPRLHTIPPQRASKQYIDGLTVAQAEYDRELKGRRDAEAEVTRLRVLLSGQTARLTVLSGDSRRQELRQQLSKEMHESLSGLEHDLSELKVQRDMVIAEMEEISASKTYDIHLPSLLTY